MSIEKLKINEQNGNFDCFVVFYCIAVSVIKAIKYNQLILTNLSGYLLLNSKNDNSILISNGDDDDGCKINLIPDFIFQCLRHANRPHLYSIEEENIYSN